MGDQYASLLDTADRIVNVDLYPARLRAVIGDLSVALREASALLDESRAYGVALVEELRARAEKTDHFVAMAASMDADFQRYADAHPASLRITGPNNDGEYWLHIKAGGKSGGINLGAEHGPISKRILDAASEKEQTK
jgi:hypothetical protein